MRAKRPRPSARARVVLFARHAGDTASRAPRRHGAGPSATGHGDGQGVPAPVLLRPLAALRRLEQRMHPLCNAARALPALTADNGADERARLVAELQRGDNLVPDFRLPQRRVPSSALRLIDELRIEAADLPGRELYQAKLEELELDLLLLDALGKPRLVRPLAARRYGTGQTPAPTARGTEPLRNCARRILDAVAPSSEARDVPALGPNSLATLVRACADAAGLEVQVRVEPRLSAGAATGERTVFLAARTFGRNEARRLAVHEVFGHLLSAANGRAQPLRLLQWGTAGCFADQEGVAIYMEELAGVLDGSRLRTLAARVLVTDWMHTGATFAEAARKLYADEQFAAPDAIAIAERAFRGGGVARDAGYLLGWLRVHAALANGTARQEELRVGRVGIDALPGLRELARDGYVRGPAFAAVFPSAAFPPPALPVSVLLAGALPASALPAKVLSRAGLPKRSRSFFSTSSGTTPLKSPPSDAASLIRLELTKK